MHGSATQVALALAALALSSCDYIEAHDMLLRGAGAHRTHGVELYPLGVHPDRPYYEVALLDVTGHGFYADVEEIQNSLRFRAEQFGCDALVRVHVDNDYGSVRGAGVCVRYAADPSLPPTCAASAANTAEAKSLGK